MRKIALRQFTFGSLAAVLLAGGSAALIASGHGGPARQATAATLALRSPSGRERGQQGTPASYLGLTPAQLREKLRTGETLAQIANATPGRSAAGLIDTIVAARTARLDAARASGRISPARAERMLVLVRTRVTAQVNHAGPARSRRLVLETAASYLGLPVTQLRDELRSGRSLAQIADSQPGKSQAGLVAALVSRRKALLEATLAASRHRQSVEEERLSSLQQRVTALVNRRFPPKG